MIDLHVHSLFSDGSDSPTEIVQKAVNFKISALALTDHDTTDGLSEFLDAAESAGINAVPGIELSADYSPGVMHILGYFIDPTCPELVEELEKVKNGRGNRNIAMLEKLNELGYPLEWDDVAKFAGTDVVGRPHFAAALVEKGLVKNQKMVFAKLLGKGGKAVVKRYRTSPQRSIELIHKAGGLAVLAHPATLDVKGAKLRALLMELNEYGLDGIEIFHPKHNDGQVGMFRKRAEEFGWIITGGTDYHGTFKPDVRLGVGFGDMEITETIYDQLKNRYENKSSAE